MRICKRFFFSSLAQKSSGNGRIFLVKNANLLKRTPKVEEPKSATAHASSNAKFKVDNLNANMKILGENENGGKSAYSHWFNFDGAHTHRQYDSNRTNPSVLAYKCKQAILNMLQGRNLISQNFKPRVNHWLRLNGRDRPHFLIISESSPDHEQIVAGKREYLERMWLDSRETEEFVFDLDTLTAFLHGFGALKDKVMVEKMHNLLVKNRKRLGGWTPATFEVIMYAHCRLENWRAVKRLWEEYEKLFNPFDPKLNIILPIEYYLLALQKSENYSHFMNYTSINLQKLSAMKLSSETYAIILTEAVRAGNVKACQSWYSVIKKELIASSNSKDPHHQINHGAELDYTILYKVLEAFSSLKSPDLALQTFHDLKRIRKKIVKQTNSSNEINLTPISMAELFEKSIKLGPYPLPDTSMEGVLPLESSTDDPILSVESTEHQFLESDKVILQKFRLWISPLMPIPQLALLLRTISLEKDIERIYSFFVDQVCTKEFLSLYWARQVSLYKKRIVDVLTHSQASLDQLKPPSTPTPLMSTKNWLKTPRNERALQSVSAQDRHALKQEITWCNRRLKRNLNVPVAYGEKGPLKYCFEAIVRGWRDGVERQGDELELENLMDRLVKLETDLVSSLNVAPFLSLTKNQASEKEEEGEEGL